MPDPARRAVDFSTEIKPILEHTCLGCHGPDKQKSKFALSTREQALKGGERGIDIVPADSARSPLIHFVARLVDDMEMPPAGKGQPLTAEEVGLLRAWIDQGAYWPADSTLAPQSKRALGEGREHWSLQPVRRPALPEVQRQGWARNPVDRFILARLEAENLAPSEATDRVMLIRRLSFTLIGLPPTPEEVQQFVADPSSSAYEALVERLLASPRYGERWARHWLDVVRFAESHGFETNTERPNAWPYRDYVIGALNDDKPYDQFIIEQLAGDALGVEEATGFLVGGAWDAVKSPDINLTLQQRMDELHDMVATTGSALLGLTVGCARCHDHKFDPIAQTDYYSMQAIFAGVQHGERARRTADQAERLQRAEVERQELRCIQAQLLKYVPLARPGQATSGPLRPRVDPRQNVDRFEPVEARFVRFTIEETTGAEPCLDELEIYTAEPEPRNVALAATGAKASASGTYAGNPSHQLQHLNDGQFGNAHSWISNESGKGWVEIELAAPVQVDRVVWGRDRNEQFTDRLAIRYKIEIALHPGDWHLVASSGDREPYKSGTERPLVYSSAGLTPEEATRLKTLIEQSKKHEDALKKLTASPMIYAGRFEQPGPTYRLNRGEPMQKREQVTPGVIQGVGSPVELSVDTPEQQRRLALARWIIDPGNPLTARVLVNRLWHYHFGRGLVSTPSDFGKMGAPPTHPELLDWLATELITHGWSIKHIQRLIVLSATYQQSSRPSAAGLKADTDSRWLWRYPPRRLEAEPIRDAILAVSGVLDLRMGGRGFDLFEPNSNYVKVYNAKKEFGPQEWRRMIYQAKPRMRLDDTFGTFDCPDAGQVAPRRNVSTTPLQALSLLNSPFILQQSELLAQRVRTEAGPELPAEIARAFLLTFNRPPSQVEAAAALTLAREEGLKILCRALFNANEFIYVF